MRTRENSTIDSALRLFFTSHRSIGLRLREIAAGIQLDARRTFAALQRLKHRNIVEYRPTTATWWATEDC